MTDTTTAFAAYIDEIASELCAAHAEGSLQLDIKHSIGDLEELAKLTQLCPTTANLYNTKNLLTIDSELYRDLIQPALVKRLTKAN